MKFNTGGNNSSLLLVDLVQCEGASLSLSPAGKQNVS